MTENETGDFDAQLAAVERFIADVQQGSVPTGEAMRAYRDVHRPAIERLRAQLADFEALLAEAGVDTAQAVGEPSPGAASASSA
jgi:chorismate-pyruvate lyase